ncbi:OmpA/MotB family protein [Candidatus Magnetominusculus xianensis]|uniref:Flagellar motor protein MotS n=1 Tax=Candidatus Magnetominusculus xianensis TaxID=1748249 RepID=A0ABR5SHD2_9BACT|nr:flagellar motor protein MotB [Candidatus Magnetominusculus xianensis]KWT82634.1 flagellar motor protein MotS [Candidatus Magnetominusculus xianensis]MBF0405283.1 flagellar motor protein MotB [Nitrospirota bacterium]
MNDSYRKLVEHSSSEAEDNLWLITMTDLMSLLLVCFLMFFVITKRQEKSAEKVQQQPVVNHQSVEMETASKEAPVTSVAAAEMTASETSVPESQSTEPASKVIVTESQIVDQAPTVDKTAAADPAPELDAVIRAQRLENDVTVTTADKGIVLTMRENVTFVPASAVILKKSMPVLDKVSELIKRHPSYVIEIDGHTDNSPINSPLYPSNWELSTARATSVLQYFIKVKGVDPSGFTVKGNGDSRPIAPNDTPHHRALNRRVEIRIKEKTI